MNTKINAKWVLQLWRERWGKGEASLPDKPYLRGSVYEWVQKVPSSSAWAFPGIATLILLISFLFFIFASNMDFSLNGQISFAGLMVVVALALRVFAGSLISLVLIYLSLLCSAQYFVWRIRSTVVFSGDTDFVLAFSFLTTELCVVFYFFLGWVNRLFPLKLAEEMLLAEPTAVPKIDVFVLSAGLTIEQATAALKVCSTLDWPQRKFQVYVMDAKPRPELAEAAELADAIYLSREGSGTDPIAAMKQGIAVGKGDFIFVVDKGLALAAKHSATESIDQKILQRVMAWFLSDSGLALLYTPNHCLAPQLSSDSLLQAHRDLASCSMAVIRRSACHTEMRELWNRSALLVPGETHHRIDRADSDGFLFWKRKSAALHAMLRFYKPLATLAFLMSPALFVLADVRLINASPDWFGAQGSACVVLIGINQSRSFNANRWGGLQELRELLLAIYMPFATSVSFLKTLVSHPAEFFRNLSALRGIGSFLSLIEGVALLSFLGLNVLTVFIGTYRLLSADAQSIYWIAGFASWALINVVLLLSRHAVLQEAQQIKRFAIKQMTLPAMIKLPHGRTMVCETVNFPCADLVLLTPARCDVTTGMMTNLSIFHNNRSYPLTVQVRKIEGLETHVCVSDVEGPEFRNVRDAVLSRGSDWPHWLPPKDADRPFPAWLTKIIASLPVKMLDLSMNINLFLQRHFYKYLSWSVFAQLWAKKK
jgi:cellulose synthase (UDP-forming)